MNRPKFNNASEANSYARNMMAAYKPGQLFRFNSGTLAKVLAVDPENVCITVICSNGTGKQTKSLHPFTIADNAQEVTEGGFFIKSF